MDPKQEGADLSPGPSLPKEAYKDPDDGRQRFFAGIGIYTVPCQSNLHTFCHGGSVRNVGKIVINQHPLWPILYVHFHLLYLAQNRYFDDEAFIGYLKYLQYWQRPEYPHCLFFLELLQNANFRNAMAHPQNKELAHRQQFYFWKNYRNNRLKHILPRPLPEAAPPPLPSEAAAAPAMPPAAPAVSGPPKVENTRVSGGERRKRKHGN